MEVLDGNSKTTKTKVLGVGNAGKCTKQRAKKAYSKKRKYHPPKNKEPAARTTHKKVVDVDMGSKTVETETVEGYRLFDMGYYLN